MPKQQENLDLLGVGFVTNNTDFCLGWWLL